MINSRANKLFIAKIEALLKEVKTRPFEGDWFVNINLYCFNRTVNEGGEFCTYAECHDYKEFITHTENKNPVVAEYTKQEARNKELKRISEMEKALAEAKAKFEREV